MGSAQKTPLARTLPLFAREVSADEILRAGLGLPGHVTAVNGAIVTVAFDVTGALIPEVMMPVAESAYVMLPIQEGDKGVALPAAVYIGGVSGLGNGTADLNVRPANLSALIWFPVGSKLWGGGNPNQVVIAGPNGVVLQDSEGNTIATLTSSTFVLNAKTTITLEVGGVSIVITSAGITINGINFLQHTHSAVQTGTGTSGPVVP